MFGLVLKPTQKELNCTTSTTTVLYTGLGYKCLVCCEGVRSRTRKTLACTMPTSQEHAKQTLNPQNKVCVDASILINLFLFCC